MNTTSGILAKVGMTAITEADVNDMIAALGQKGQNYNTIEGRKHILEQLIDQQLFLCDAKRNFMEADPEFQAQLARVKDELLVQFAIAKAIKGSSVTEAEIKQFYEANQSQFVADESVAASHILVDTEDKAAEILAKIKAGQISFEDAAKQFSSCPSSAEGGALGEFTRGQMVPEFDSAVFAMEVGEISAPVKTQFGYHLIKLTDKKEAAVLPYAQVREQIYAHLMNEKQRAAYQSKVNQLKILFPVDRY